MLTTDLLSFQTESPILLQPYLQDLTLSEIHAVMAAGFAAVSGTVLAAYISFGASASHLITASVMSAPASLCFAKLFYPETEETTSTKEKIVIPERFVFRLFINGIFNVNKRLPGLL